jgi:hypothetical protein
MPDDPFVKAHEVSSCIYDLNLYSPFSIRDQLVRTALFVDRANFTGKLPNKTMLIIGAGVAGIAAAVRGVAHGIRSLVIEREEKALTRFGQCSSRWIEPTHYDWPAEHWNRGYLPGLPLNYRALPASALAAEWETQLIQLRLKGRITFKTDIQKFEISKPDPTIKVDVGFPVDPSAFDLVLHCEGPGDENCRIGDYDGYRFWQTDDFERVDLGVKEGAVPKVLISGSGDGALQDFIRIATGFRSVGEFLTAVAGNGEVRLRQYVQSAEDQALRSAFWDTPGSNPHTRLRRLDSVYQAAIDKLSEREPDLHRELWRRMGDLINPRIRDSRSIHVTHYCTHLSPCYALNRIVARLVMAYLREVDFERFTFLPNTATAKVTSKTHECKCAEECHGEEHLVTFMPGACPDNGSAPPFHEGVYNVIVVRHGVRRPDRDHRPPFQLLPYYLDDIRI